MSLLGPQQIWQTRKVIDLSPGDIVKLSRSTVAAVWEVKINDERFVLLVNPRSKRRRYFYKSNDNHIKAVVWKFLEGDSPL